MEEDIIFLVGPGEFASGILIKRIDKRTRIVVKKMRYAEGFLEVKLLDESWYRVKNEDYFGANV